MVSFFVTQKIIIITKFIIVDKIDAKISYASGINIFSLRDVQIPNYTLSLLTMKYINYTTRYSVYIIPLFG